MRVKSKVLLLTNNSTDDETYSNYRYAGAAQAKAK
jgi:hypothetical protein